jgi:hypothetical protein
MPERPFSELPPAEPELLERARQSLAALRGRGRTQTGQAAAGNTIALRDGLHSPRLLNVPAIASWHAEQVAAIEADLGGALELSALERGFVRELARLEVIVAALGEDVLQHGTLTGKGKTRAATLAYLRVLDRYERLAGRLGLQRKQKRVPDLQEYIASRRQGPAAASPREAGS